MAEVYEIQVPYLLLRGVIQWDTAAQRGKSTGSGIGVATIPIELFNTSVTQRPFGK